MKNILVWLSSAREDVLEDSPGDRPKYIGIGSAIVITGTIAGVAMTYALASAVKASLWVAVPFGVAWAVGIMLLDRWLVATIQRGSWVQNILTTVPRLLLAVLLGLVISTPLVLRIFEPEIVAEISRMQQEKADAFQRQQREGDVGRDIAALTAQRDELQRIIASGGDAPSDPEADPEIRGLRAQLKEAETARDEAVKKLDCQLYGPCKPTGPGPLADAARRELNLAEARIKTIDGQIEKRKRELNANDEASRAQRVADAKAALPGVQRRLEDRIRQQESLRRQFEERQRNANGLLARIEALDRLSERDSSMGRAHRLLILLFTAIEILPVLVKLLMLFAPENNYERILKDREREELLRAQVKSRAGADGQALSDDILKLWGMPPDPPGSEGGEAPPKPTTPMPDGPAPAQTGGRLPEEGYPSEDSRRLMEMPDANVRGYDGERLDFGDGAFEDGRRDDLDDWKETSPGGWEEGTAADRRAGAASDGWSDDPGDDEGRRAEPASGAWDSVPFSGGREDGAAGSPRSVTDDFADPRAAAASDSRRADSSGGDEGDRLLKFDD